MSPADTFLSLIGQGHVRPPLIPSHVVPKLVELGVGHEIIGAAWNLCFWTGWWGGMLVGFLLAAVTFLTLAALVLAIACLVLWISNRRLNHAATMAVARPHPYALPDPRTWPDPR